MKQIKVAGYKNLNKNKNQNRKILKNKSFTQWSLFFSDNCLYYLTLYS